MLWSLIKKELLGHILEFRFGVSAVLCVVLALVSVSVLRGDLEYKRKNVQAARRVSDAYLKELLGRSSRLAAESRRRRIRDAVGGRLR